MNPKHKKAFTLTEILVVIAIMGFLVALVMPRFSDTIDFASAKMNKAQMEEIKRASLEFYNDVGFVPDNVSLLTYPWESCDVQATNYNDSDSSDLCINMIAFVDKHYKFTTSNPALRTSGTGDNGSDTQRVSTLIEIIEKKLNPNYGWKGSYIGGNSVLTTKNIKTLGNTGDEEDNLYYFSDKDVKIYYDGHASSDSLNAVDSTWDDNSANEELYPLFATNFSVEMDDLYENGKYSKGTTRETTFLGAMTVLDPYGTPYEIKIPTDAAVTAYD